MDYNEFIVELRNAYSDTIEILSEKLNSWVSESGTTTFKLASGDVTVNNIPSMYDGLRPNLNVTAGEDVSALRALYSYVESGSMLVKEIPTNGLKTATEFDSGTIVENSTAYDSDNDKVVIFYENEAETAILARIGTVVDEEYTYGDSIEIHGGAVSTHKVIHCDGDSNAGTLAFVYSEGESPYDIYIKIGTSNGTSITLGGATKVTNSVSAYPNCPLKIWYHSSTNQIFILYQNNETSIQMSRYNINGLTNTVGSVQPLTVISSVTTLDWSSFDLVIDEDENNLLVFYTDTYLLIRRTRVMINESPTSSTIGAFSANPITINQSPDTITSSVALGTGSIVRDESNSFYCYSDITSTSYNIRLCKIMDSAGTLSKHYDVDILANMTTVSDYSDTIIVTDYSYIDTDEMKLILISGSSSVEYMGATIHEYDISTEVPTLIAVHDISGVSLIGVQKNVICKVGHGKYFIAYGNKGMLYQANMDSEFFGVSRVSASVGDSMNIATVGGGQYEITANLTTVGKKLYISGSGVISSYKSRTPVGIQIAENKVQLV